jgi:hypothetical protein
MATLRNTVGSAAAPPLSPAIIEMDFSIELRSPKETDDDASDGTSLSTGPAQQNILVETTDVVVKI